MVSMTPPARVRELKPSEIERQFSEGETIVERGSTTRELYVIRSGEVRLEGAEDDRALLLGPGDMFGEIAVILGEPHASRAVADSEVMLVVIDVPLLNRLCSENADFSFRLIRHLAQRVSSPEITPGDAGPALQSGAEMGRLAKAILRRAGRGDPPRAVDGKLRDLAQDAGLSMLRSYLLVQNLLEQRVLRLADDRLSLLEPEKLKTLGG